MTRVALLAVLLFSKLDAQGHQRPDFSGVWSSATATPLERPAELAGKAFFTPKEAAEWERKAASRNEEAPRPASGRAVGTYNAAFWEYGSKVGKTLRTSIVIDPPDGHIPELTPKAAAEKKRRMELLRNPGIAQDLGLQDQCLLFPTDAPPMLPYSYNSNYQIVQTGNTVVIHAEMPHDTRVIALDRSAHLPRSLRLWLGDSIGHWEGGTLVVDTTNFNDAGGFFGDAGGMYGWDRNLHVVERFSLFDPQTILYQFEVDDPTAYTRPWKGEMTISRSNGRVFEYACHEGNYALPNLLNVFRGQH